MDKGEQTRQRVLQAGLRMASVEGLTGVSLAPLARRARLSKSGLFSHFESKEDLQIQILDHAGAEFERVVIAPALEKPPGVVRLRDLFESWLGWPSACRLPGGCVFTAAASELDDLPGPVREHLRAQQERLLNLVSTQARKAVKVGELRADADPEQFAFELYGIYLAHHLSHRLLGSESAGRSAGLAFAALLDRHRA